MAFDGRYLEWNQRRIKGIVDFYGHKFFFYKKIVDLGCGYGDVGGVLQRLGADITVIDVRQEHLKIAAKKFPGIKIIKADLDLGSPFGNKKFDLILDLDLLCHLRDYEAHLRYVCAATTHLVLETTVCDSDDPTKVISLTENKNIYDLSFNGVSTRPSAAAIERILTDCQMNFRRLDQAKFNVAPYVYDWTAKNDNSSNINNRRIWFAVKKNSPIQFSVPTAMAPHNHRVGVPSAHSLPPAPSPAATPRISPPVLPPPTVNNTTAQELGQIDPNKPFITFKDLGKSGRLGNQFFQMAALIGTAAKYNTDIRVKWTCSYTNKSITNFLKNQIWQEIDPPVIGYNYKEPSFNYHEIPFHKNMNMQGFFQSERYFENNKDLVRYAFEPSNEMINKLRSQYGSLLDSNTCAIHVRRGDYVNNKAYYQCDLKYYQGAIDKINSLEKIDHFMVFSDDITWCKRYLPSNYIFVQNNMDIEDLFLMSLNKHNIMSNSSFSWWGSWLNKNPSKKIVVPKQWFSTKHGLNANDLYTKEMIRL